MKPLPEHHAGPTTQLALILSVQEGEIPLAILEEGREKRGRLMFNWAGCMRKGRNKKNRSAEKNSKVIM